MNARERIALRTKRLRQRWLLFFWRQARKIVIAVTGGTILLAGIVMLALPGPGWLTIFAGLAILAPEFAWARWVLKSAKDRVTALMQQSQANTEKPVTPPDPKDLKPSESPQIPIDLNLPIDRI